MSQSFSEGLDAFEAQVKHEYLHPTGPPATYQTDPPLCAPADALVHWWVLLDRTTKYLTTF